MTKGTEIRGIAVMRKQVAAARANCRRAIPAKLVEVNSSVLAEVLSLTTRRVEQLVRRGMPRSGHGRYPLRSCVRWYIRDMRGTASDWVARKCLLRLQAQIAKMIDAIEDRRPLYRSELRRSDMQRNQSA